MRFWSGVRASHRVRTEDTGRHAKGNSSLKGRLTRCGGRPSEIDLQSRPALTANKPNSAVNNLQVPDPPGYPLLRRA
jgi:hypothetical protein